MTHSSYNISVVLATLIALTTALSADLPTSYSTGFTPEKWENIIKLNEDVKRCELLELKDEETHMVLSSKKVGALVITGSNYKKISYHTYTYHSETPVAKKYIGKYGTVATLSVTGEEVVSVKGNNLYYYFYSLCKPLHPPKK